MGVMHPIARGVSKLHPLAGEYPWGFRGETYDFYCTRMYRWQLNDYT